jgi:hypothetical protein
MPVVPSGLMRRLRRERQDRLDEEDAEEFLQLLLAAMDTPEVQTKLRAVLADRSPRPASPAIARGGARGGRGR